MVRCRSILLQALLHQARQAESVLFGEFEQRLKAGKVADLVILPDYIDGTLSDDAGASHPFVTARVDPLIAGEPAKSGVTYGGGVANKGPCLAISGRRRSIGR